VLEVTKKKIVGIEKSARNCAHEARMMNSK